MPAARQREPFWVDGVCCQPHGPEARTNVVVGKGCVPKAEQFTVRVKAGESLRVAVLKHAKFPAVVARAAELKEVGG